MNIAAKRKSLLAIVYRSSPVSDADRNRLVLSIDLPAACSC